MDAIGHKGCRETSRISCILNLKDKIKEKTLSGSKADCPNFGIGTKTRQSHVSSESPSLKHHRGSRLKRI